MTAIHDDEIIVEGEAEPLDRLDEVLKRLVVVNVSDKVGPGVGELTVLEDILRMLSDRASSGWKIRSTLLRSLEIVQRWTRRTSWKKWKQSCISRIQGSASTCQVVDLTYSSA